MYNLIITILSMLIYITITLSVFLLFMPSLCTTTGSLSHTWNKTPPITILILTIIAPLGGLPPLSGFLPKWIIIQEITKMRTSFYHTNSHQSSPQHIFLLAANILHITNYIPFNKQHKNKTIRIYKTNNLLGAALMENSMEFPQKTKNRVAIWSSNPPSGHVPRQNYISKRYMHP